MISLSAWITFGVAFILALVLLRRAQRPYRVDLIWVWQRVHVVDPVLTHRTLLRRRGFVEWNQSRPLLGMAFYDHTADVYLDPKPSVGLLVSTILHEWVHLRLGHGRHDEAFRRELLQLLSDAGLQISHTRLTDIEEEAARLFDIAASWPVRAERGLGGYKARVRWKRGRMHAIAA